MKSRTNDRFCNVGMTLGMALLAFQLTFYPPTPRFDLGAFGGAVLTGWYARRTVEEW